MTQKILPDEAEGSRLLQNASTQQQLASVDASTTSPPPLLLLSCATAKWTRNAAVACPPTVPPL